MSLQTTTTQRAYTLAEFCEAYRISRAHFYNLEKDGRAPKRMGEVGDKVLISVESAERWRKKMESDDD